MEAPTQVRVHLRVRVLLGWAAAFLALMTIIGVTGALAVQASLYGSIDKLDVPLGGPHARPPEANPDAMDVALLGAADDEFVSLMVLHIDAARRSAVVRWIPMGDAHEPEFWRRVAPGSLQATDAATIVRRTEHLTSVRIEHFAVFDWRVVGSLADQYGGLDLSLSAKARTHLWREGVHVTGANVIRFVDAPDGSPELARSMDLNRIYRQERLLQAVLDRALEQELLRHPLRLYHLLATVADGLTIDAGWSRNELTTLALSLRALRSHSIRYTIQPRT